jgi:alkylated DNA nucleotide flippase Atl1
MPGELVFTVEGSDATPAVPISLADAGLRERNDLQEWVLAHPEILGADVLVITFEFDRWLSGSGTRERDRLDVLALDGAGRLVVVELKRDRAPDTVEMQALKYAAMASRFTEDSLVEQYARFLSRGGTPVEEAAAREALLAHAGELDPETLRRPRIVLVAASFPPPVTASVVWLTEMGLDIGLQRVQAYRVFGDRTVITVSQLFPILDVEEFTIGPQRAELSAMTDRRRRGRERSTVLRLVASEEIPDGTELTLLPMNDVTADVREAIAVWVAENPDRGRAIWHNERRGPLEWCADGERYRPTAIVQRVLLEAAGLQRSPRGPAWWVLPDGRTLPEAAGPGGAFDWARLHQLLQRLPVGRWTSYGDLAALVGTAPQPLGNHVAGCMECENAHRLLGRMGRSRPGFAWADPEDGRTQQEALEAEGIVFTEGVADPGKRLTAEELDGLGDE